MAEMLLTAGDDLLVTSQADSWESAADFGVGMRDGSEWNFPPFELPDDFSERINRRVQAAMERAQSHLEAASRCRNCRAPGLHQDRSRHAPGRGQGTRRRSARPARPGQHSISAAGTGI